jgi:hypothetical protein
LIIDKSEIKDAKGIANAFNNYFSSIGEKLANAESISSDCSPMDFMDPPQINSMVLTPVTSEEILNEICKTDSSKSTGPFSIPSKILKLIQNQIAYTLNL